MSERERDKRETSATESKTGVSFNMLHKDCGSDARPRGHVPAVHIKASRALRGGLPNIDASSCGRMSLSGSLANVGSTADGSSAT